MKKFFEEQLICVSDACDYETFGVDIDRVEIRKAMEKTIKLIKQSAKKNIKPKRKV